MPSYDQYKIYIIILIILSCLCLKQSASASVLALPYLSLLCTCFSGNLPL